MRVASSTLCLLISVLAACSDPFQPEIALPGTWSTGRMTFESGGSWEVVLTFTPNGQFTQRVTMYGLYPGNSANDRSSATVISGAYSTEDNTLSISPTAYLWWDSFYENPGPHTGEPSADLYTDCSFEVSEQILTLRYITYPADAPVETMRSFYRLR